MTLDFIHKMGRFDEVRSNLCFTPHNHKILFFLSRIFLFQFSFVCICFVNIVNMKLVALYIWNFLSLMFYDNDPWDSHGFLLPRLSSLLCNSVICSSVVNFTPVNFILNKTGLWFFASAILIPDMVVTYLSIIFGITYSPPRVEIRNEVLHSHFIIGFFECLNWRFTLQQFFSRECLKGFLFRLMTMSLLLPCAL